MVRKGAHLWLRSAKIIDQESYRAYKQKISRTEEFKKQNHNTIRAEKSLFVVA
jgi:hypothetical protein